MHAATTRRPLPTSGQLPRHRASVVSALDREWGRLRHRRVDSVGVDRWSSGDGALDAFADRWYRTVAVRVEDLVELTDRTHGAEGDAFLGWLVAVSSEEVTATRVVLQRLLPLLLRESARWTRPRAFGERSTTPAIDELLAAATIEIARRREVPIVEQVAPRLVAATVHHAFRKHTRRVHCGVETAARPASFDERIAQSRRLDGTVAVARLLAAGAARGVEPHLLDLARRLAAGETTASIAEERQCSARAVRKQRAALARSIRSALGDGWDEWDDPLVGLEYADR